MLVNFVGERIIEIKLLLKFFDIYYALLLGLGHAFEMFKV